MAKFWSVAIEVEKIITDRFLQSKRIWPQKLDETSYRTDDEVAIVQRVAYDVNWTTFESAVNKR